MYTHSKVESCPFMVVLKQWRHRNLGYCGGSVLTATLTLTAAHCLMHGKKGLRLKFGSTNLFKGGVEHEATKLIRHEQFALNILANDVGIVSIFPNRIEFGVTVQPVRLPAKSSILEDGTFVKVFGWGATSVHKSYSEILRQVDLPIVNREVCKSLLTGVLPYNTFCAGFFDGHVDACTGDSGGPAMHNSVQVGITSFGEGCAMELKPGVYTDLSKFVDWINMKKNTEM